MSSPNCLPGVGCPGAAARRGKLKEKLTGGQGEDLLLGRGLPAHGVCSWD